MITLIATTGPGPVPVEVYVGTGSSARGRLDKAMCLDLVIRKPEKRARNIGGSRWINPGSRMDRGAMISTHRWCGYANKCSDRVGWGFGSSAFTLASLVPERMINDQKSLVLYKKMHAPTRFVHFE